ncbi:MAG: zinc-dependent metalloprotease [Bacteroidota bacterium]
MKHTLLILGILLICSWTSNGQNSTLLFNDYEGNVNSEQQNIIDNNLALPSVKQNNTIVIDQSILENPTLELRLFDNQILRFEEFDIGHSGINYRYWTGQNAAGDAAFLINGDRISGHISGAFGNYEIYPLGNGVHLFAELDNEQFDGCGNENEEQIFTPKDNKQGTEKSVVGTECFIRLIVGYTSLAKSRTASNFGRTMNEHIGLAVIESNQGYANSDVELRVELAFSYETDDNETFFSGTDVNALQSQTDGKWDEIHGFRDDYDGDMVALVTGGQHILVCGQAFGFDYTDDANMFQVSEYNCIVGNYTFAHEFGHNQGCRHDNDGTQTPFTYARGYNDGAERTIMAVSSTPPRRNHWSNPDINFPSGNVTGTADRDNARALDFGDATVASHRVTPMDYAVDVVVEEDQTINMVTTNLLTSTSDVEAGAILELKSQGSVTLQAGFHAKPGSEMRAYVIPLCTASYSLQDEEKVEGRTAQVITLDKNDLQIAPNPTYGNIQLTWTQQTDKEINIELKDAYGRSVMTLLTHTWYSAGEHQLEINTSHLASGLYYLVLNVEEQATVKSVVILN